MIDVVSNSRDCRAQIERVVGRDHVRDASAEDALTAFSRGGCGAGIGGGSGGRASGAMTPASASFRMAAGPSFDWGNRRTARHCSFDQTARSRPGTWPLAT